MSAPSQPNVKIGSAVSNLRAQIENTRVAGRPLMWFVRGWRLGLVVLLLAVLLPYATGNQALIETGIGVGIYVLLALGLNIVVGFAGLLDLGYVAFYAIGAFTVGALTGGLLQGANGKPITIHVFSWWMILPVAAILAALAGAILGAPTLRLRGDYLAIVTLGFGEIVPVVFNNVPFFFGPLGLSPNAPDDTNLGPLGTVSWGNPVDRTAYYMLTLALVVIAVIAVSSLRNSSLGRAWVAVREDETAAAASGVNLVRAKLLAFSLGALFGGIGGALYAGDIGHVDYTLFSFQVSITVLVMIVLGGLGSIPGAIVGAVVLTFFNNYFLKQIDAAVHSNPLVTSAGAPFHILNGVDFNVLSLLFYGILLVLMVRVRPQGLIPDARRVRELKGIGAAPEGASAVGLLAREEAGIEEPGEEFNEESTYTGAGSDAQGRES
ncbi:MAG: branched-chain amino acid ABC transporter permease [Ktedonobacterales bacterium]